MEKDVFDRETMLDLSVNVVPLFIILFFVGLFVAVAPFGYELGPTSIQMSLLVVPFVGLAILTYYSGKAISTSEAEVEARERALTTTEEAASTGAAGDAPDPDIGGEGRAETDD